MDEVGEVDELVVLAIDCQYVFQKWSSTFEHAGVGSPSSLVDRVMVVIGQVKPFPSPHAVDLITQVRESHAGVDEVDELVVSVIRCQYVFQ